MHIEQKTEHTDGQYHQECDLLVYGHGPIPGISRPSRPGDP